MADGAPPRGAHVEPASPAFAFVELMPDKEASEAEIIEHCRAKLAHFKVPKTVIFGPLPRTSTGKIQKFLLRKRARSAEAIA